MQKMIIDAHKNRALENNENESQFVYIEIIYLMKSLTFWFKRVSIISLFSSNQGKINLSSQEVFQINQKIQGKEKVSYWLFEAVTKRRVEREE